MTADAWTPSVAARIDWPALLADIAHLLGEPRQDNPDLREPCPDRELARQLEIPRGTLRGWLDGSEPRHSDGERLLQRWCQLTGKARTFAPIDRWVYSAAKAR